jgi:hypothetical protein
MRKRFKMKDTNGIGTPIALKCQLDLGPNGKLVEQKLYWSMICLLLYLCVSDPKLILSVGVHARYQAAPKESHLMVLKRIFWYLIDTPIFGLWYPKMDRKSTSGACHFLGRSLVYWSSKEQNYASLSPCDAECVAAASCCTQVLWIAYNPVLHRKTKHMDTRNHFILDHIARNDVELSFIGTKDQLPTS